MHEGLKRRVYEANMLLPEHGLVTFTWGNVSEREGDWVAIKPSGVAYRDLRPEDVVVTDLEGNPAEPGAMRPSSDLPTHLEIYRRFGPGAARGVTHTHSQWACAWAQAGLPVPALGTTHADYFHGDVPCTRQLTDEEIAGAYERNTGVVIAEAFLSQGIDPQAVPGALVRGHGPFAWGASAADSVHNAVVLEQVAKTAFLTRALQGWAARGGAPGPWDPEAPRFPQALLDKHYRRKHGAGAYYGQPGAAI
jgi:L-ribulose-5-phosphate 4-epimerase